MTATGPSNRVKYNAAPLHPGKAEDGCRNQVETALSRSIARRTDTLWSIPQMGTSAALCHLAKTPVCVWPALNRPKQPPPPKPPSYYPNPSYMSSNPLAEPTPSQDRHKVKEQNFHNCCAGVSQPLPYTSDTSAIERWSQSRCKSLCCLLIIQKSKVVSEDLDMCSAIVFLQRNLESPNNLSKITSNNFHWQSFQISGFCVV